MTVLERFLKGDHSALPKIVSFIEDREKGFRRLLSQLYPKTGKAIKIGFTGPPGAGKSSLVNCVAGLLVSEGKKVGIIAIDPSSPFTGGALLGDRIRLTNLPHDGSVYIRSMATRGSTGGLATATDNVTVALDAFGFDYILIETVGVGQVELDIIDTCDTVVVVLVPESGDAVQALKAGLMEIADIFALNKADRPGSQNIIASLEMTLAIKREKSAWSWPVIPTEAINNKNINALLTSIKEHIDFSKKTGRFEEHRKRQIRRKIHSILHNRMSALIENQLGKLIDLDRIVADIYAGNDDPYSASEKLVDFKSISLNDH